MTPIQQLMLGAGGAKKKTYMDDVFSNYLYNGTSATHAINNGIDLAGEGGLVWTKARNQTWSNLLIDTVRGGDKVIFSELGNAQASRSDLITSFNNNGYTAGADSYYGSINYNTADVVSWTFRKAPGFFDVKTFTGQSNSFPVVNHDLGCKPGLVIYKKTSGAEDWFVWHRDFHVNSHVYLNKTDSIVNNYGAIGEVSSTSTKFYTSTSTSDTYVAYFFAGGESTAATARSVDFDGDDYLSLPVDSDLDLGNSDFTFEAWFKPDTNNSNQYIFNTNNNGLQVYWTADKVIVYGYDGSSWFINGEQSPDSAKRGLWNHVAVTRSNNVFRCFLNGNVFYEATHNNTFVSLTTSPTIGRYSESNLYFFYGKISNLRLVKGTAVYTSSFRPPTEPLTNITNTKLLCCNNSSTTGSTVTPGTITANGNPTASSDSPFDDPAGFVFGESGSESVIKTGSYVGNGSSTGPEINLGWEPQWVMVKRTDSTDNWAIYDVMRGITTGGTDNQLRADQSAVEHTTGNTIAVTPTGFKFETSGSEVNANSGEYLYMAIRRPDGYVGKPRTATELFAMAYGNSGGTNPSFVSNFPVDFAFNRQPATTEAWYTAARLMQGRYLYANGNDGENTSSNFVFDHNNGWRDGSAVTTYFNHMWRRSNSFDTIIYKGDGQAGREIRHSMNKIPQMMWIKKMDSSDNWAVYHFGLNSGSSPENYYIVLNGSDNQVQHTTRWNDTAPTSTHFTVGTSSWVNNNGSDYLAILFSSETGISKCGYYDGSSSSQTITTGFQPRFVILRRANYNYATDWHVLDTTRGWGSGTDQYLALNSSQAQAGHDIGAPTSTGFTLTVDAAYNGSGGKYIYYAHA